ncbi:HpcH/HpaI aldolase/citrate lyase family protein [Sciscionella marina]|uniref:HpcH/HpaI aldolase/citrate lyase family protein n=1 Tax=Sciscionella marina TaxID=508770 RepID=UPI0003A34615|nr:CoA ester lyase [Sciscionella marina]
MSAPRSWLFVPGDRAERFAKAAASGTDAVVCDLEDAVSAEHKASARTAVAEWVREHEACVRVNGTGTEWHTEDIAALAGAPGLRGVMLPKSEQVDQLHQVHRASGGTPVIALVESALGVHEATSIARVPGVARLAFGSLDFGLDAGIEVGWEELLYARSRIVLASRVAGIPAPVDGVTTALDDAELLAREANAAHRLGFGGKLAIHPSQVPGINAAFRPAAEQLEWARSVLAAVAESGTSAVRVNGQMIDKPRVELARRLLEEEGQ